MLRKLLPLLCIIANIGIAILNTVVAVFQFCQGKIAEGASAVFLVVVFLAATVLWIHFLKEECKKNDS